MNPSFDDPDEGIDVDIDDINLHLLVDLGEPFLSIEAGFFTLYALLSGYGIEVDFLMDGEDDADEEIHQVSDELFLYVCYCITDDGYYEFYSELADEDSLKEILTTGEEEEEQE